MKGLSLNLLLILFYCALGQRSFADSAPNCVIPVEQGLWRTFPGWSAQVSKFVDRQAAWLSTTPYITTAQGPGCAMLSHQYKQIFLASLQVPSDGIYRVEVLADDGGLIQILQNSDIGSSVMSLQSDGNYMAASVTLKQGTYSVVLTNWDTGGYATAILASIQSSSGDTVLRTSDGGIWSQSVISQ